MTTPLVTLDTETGIVNRYMGRERTHSAGLTCDPEDGTKTAAVIETFRMYPNRELRVQPRRPRTYEDALEDQRARFAQAQKLLPAPEKEHA